MDDLFGGNYNHADFSGSGDGAYAYDAPAIVPAPYYHYSVNPNAAKQIAIANAPYAAGRGGAMAAEAFIPQQNNPFNKPSLLAKPIVRASLRGDPAGPYIKVVRGDDGATYAVTDQSYWSQYAQPKAGAIYPAKIPVVAAVANQPPSPFVRPLARAFIRGLAEMDFSGLGDDTGDTPPSAFSTFADSAFAPSYVQAYVPPAADSRQAATFPIPDPLNSDSGLTQFASSVFPDFLAPSIPTPISSGPAALNYQLTRDSQSAPVSFAKSVSDVVSKAGKDAGNLFNIFSTTPVKTPNVTTPVVPGRPGNVGPVGPRGGSTIAQDINAVVSGVMSIFAPLAAAKAQKQQAAAARGPRQPQGHGGATSPALDTKTIAMIGGGVLLLGGIVYFAMKD